MCAINLNVLSWLKVHPGNISDHFSNDLTIHPKEPIEGNDISISCKVKRKNISSVWYKNGTPVKGTPRMKFDVKGQKHILTIHKAKVTDSNTYCIEIEGVKKETYLGVEGKIHHYFYIY